MLLGTDRLVVDEEPGQGIGRAGVVNAVPHGRRPSACRTWSMAKAMGSASTLCRVRSLKTASREARASRSASSTLRTPRAARGGGQASRDERSRLSRASSTSRCRSLVSSAVPASASSARMLRARWTSSVGGDWLMVVIPKALLPRFTSSRGRQVPPRGAPGRNDEDSRDRAAGGYGRAQCQGDVAASRWLGPVDRVSGS